MRISRLLALLLLLVIIPARAQEPQAVSAVLDDFHAAAAKADGTRYFGHFAEGAIFLGTDISERWTVEEFKAYAMPHFQRGQGWTYKATSRHIYLARDQRTAWFDEVLFNEKYGDTRGSGVLVKVGDSWKLSQYHLTLPVPNDLMPQVVKMIQTSQP
jgi:hypothetical protein